LTTSPQPSLISLSGHGITVSNNNIEDSGLAGSILDIGNSTAVLVSGNVLETSDAHADTRWAITARNHSSAFISANLFVNANAIQPGIPGLAANNNWIAGKLKTTDEDLHTSSPIASMRTAGRRPAPSTLPPQSSAMRLSRCERRTALATSSAISSRW
jgi:hypothetical protein